MILSNFFTNNHELYINDLVKCHYNYYIDHYIDKRYIFTDLDPVDVFPAVSGGVVRVDPLLTVGLKILVLLGLFWSHGNAGDVEVSAICVVQQGHSVQTSLQ